MTQHLDSHQSPMNHSSSNDSKKEVHEFYYLSPCKGQERRIRKEGRKEGRKEDSYHTKQTKFSGRDSGII